MEKIFRLRENHTSVRTEIVAGVTTFMTMAYIIALNPNILTSFGAYGTDIWNGVFLATIISAATGCFCMAFLANKPFVMAPCMGLNSFFAVIVANVATVTGLSYLESYRGALCIILIEGILFVILSLMKVREKIVEGIPRCIRLGIAPAIGFMLLNIGFGSNAGVYSENAGPFYIMRDFFGALSPAYARENMGSGYDRMVLYVITMFVGLLAIVAFSHRKMKSAVLLGILVGSCVGWVGEAVFLHKNPFGSFKNANFLPPFSDFAATTLFSFDFSNLLKLGVFTTITLIVTFCMIDMFDTVGTLVGTATRAGMVDENGNMPKMKEALLSDAIGTVAGACTGTSTVTTFAESATGVEAGGRTGLTSLTAGVLFLLCMFLAPIAAVIPPAATSSALIYVGYIMLGGLKYIDFSRIDEGLPVSIMLLAMPVSGSVGHAIGLAMITHTGICVLTGKAKEVPLLTYAISLLFLIKFFVVV